MRGTAQLILVSDLYKILRLGYFWPGKECQFFAKQTHVPPELMTSVISPIFSSVGNRLGD